MKNFCTLIMLLFVALSISTLSGCGKMSNPEPLEGSGYPHRYPRY